MKKNLIDYGLLSLIAVIIAISAVLLIKYPETYRAFVAEDGIVEWTGTLALFAGVILTVIRIFKLWSSAKRLFIFCLILTALLFFFGGGEEISWGQRIFKIQSSQFFLENNAQSETNLHNLHIGDYKINKIIFSKLLLIIIVLYLVALPILYRRSPSIKKLTDSLAIPIPRNLHIIAFFTMALVIEMLRDSRRWEIFEMGGAIIFFIILINPLNIKLFNQPHK